MGVHLIAKLKSDGPVLEEIQPDQITVQYLVEVKDTLDSMNVGTEILSMETDVTAYAELSWVGTVLTEMSSIMKLAMSFAEMVETLVNMNVMTEIELTLMDAMNTVSKNNKGPKLLAKEHSFQ